MADKTLRSSGDLANEHNLPGLDSEVSSQVGNASASNSEQSWRLMVELASTHAGFTVVSLPRAVLWSGGTKFAAGNVTHLRRCLAGRRYRRFKKGLTVTSAHPQLQADLDNIVDNVDKRLTCRGEMRDLERAVYVLRELNSMLGEPFRNFSEVMAVLRHCNCDASKLCHIACAGNRVRHNGHTHHWSRSSCSNDDIIDCPLAPELPTDAHTELSERCSIEAYEIPKSISDESVPSEFGAADIDDIATDVDMRVAVVSVERHEIHEQEEDEEDEDGPSDPLGFWFLNDDKVGPSFSTSSRVRRPSARCAPEHNKNKYIKTRRCQLEEQRIRSPTSSRTHLEPLRLLRTRTGKVSTRRRRFILRQPTHSLGRTSTDSTSLPTCSRV